MNNLQRVFVVRYVDNIKYNRPFRTFEEAENFIYQLFDQDVHTSLNDHMVSHNPMIIYGVNPDQDIIIFEPHDSYGITVTNSFDQFVSKVSHLLPIDKEKHYGTYYVNFQKTKVYPSEQKVKHYANRRHRKYVKAYKKYKAIIDRKILSTKYNIVENNANSVIDFCYNSMITELDDKFQRQLIDHKINIGYNSIVPYFESQWKYVHFTEYIPVKFNRYDKAGIRSGSDRCYDIYELNFKEKTMIMSILNEALEYYLDGNHAVATITLMKLHGIFEGFKRDGYNDHESLFD